MTDDPSSRFTKTQLGSVSQRIRQAINKDESLADVIAGAAFLAARRAELLGRDPLSADLEFVLAAWCWWPLKPPPPPSVSSLLVANRSQVFRNSSRGDFTLLGRTMPDETLTLELPELFAKQREAVASYLAHLPVGPSAKSSAIESLRSVPGLRRMTQKLVDDLAERTEVVDYTGRAVVFREGEQDSRLLVVAEGRVTIERQGEPLGVLGPGSVIGEVILLRDSPRRATVVADPAAVFYVLKHEDIVRVLDDHPKAARTLRSALTRRLQSGDRRLLG